MNGQETRWQRIEELFEEATRLMAPDREAYLRQACGSDTTLYQELASLLAHDDLAQGEEHWAAAAAGALVAASWKNETTTAERELGAGTQLGPYTIVSVAGVGAMGRVYRARDERLGRDIAIKTLADAFRNEPGRLARLRREGALLASLNHPNIGAIHDVFELSGDLYLVLEFADGADLAEQLRDGPMQLDDVLRVGCQIVEALEAAHANGVIHRDLKPTNIRVTSEGRVKIVDFGIATTNRHDLSGTERDPRARDHVATIHTVMAGTPAYMSPEQARGDVVDARTDLWAFGCVLYEMVTGRKAFDGEATSSASAGDEGPVSADYRSIPAGTPRPLVWLIQRCLQPAIDARLQRASEARAVIVSLLSTPQRAPRAALAAALRVVERRWRVIVIPGFGLLAAALYVGSFASFGSQRVASAPAGVIEWPNSQIPASLQGVIDGVWAGDVDTGTGIFRFVLYVTTADNSLNASADLPSQGRFAIPVSAVSRDGALLHVELSSIGVRFEGQLDSGLTKMDGSWIAADQTIPVVLTRIQS